MIDNLSEDGFHYPPKSDSPPRIQSFESQKKEIEILVKELTHLLNGNAKALSLLKTLLKKWGPFYLNFIR